MILLTNMSYSCREQCMAVGQPANLVRLLPLVREMEGWRSLSISDRQEMM